MNLPEAVIKRTAPVRIAEAVATAPGAGPENVAPVFVPLSDEVLAHLEREGVKPGISVAHYEMLSEDGSLTMHVGFEIGGQTVSDSERVRVVELPVVEVASAIHRGAMQGLAAALHELIRWTEESGYERAGPSRELYHVWNYDDPAGHVTELQLVLGASGRSAVPRL